MNIGSFSLPPGCTIRQAKISDRWDLQKLVWKFIVEEALGFYIRLLIWRSLILLSLYLSLFICGQLLIIGNISLRIIVIAVSQIFLITAIYRTCMLILFIISIFTIVFLGWSHYWVVESNKSLIACAGFTYHRTHSELAYLYVKPKRRYQGIGRVLVQQFYQNAPVELPLYLVCKPKMVDFYAKLNFVALSWQDLPPHLKIYFKDFQPHLKLTGFPLILMQASKKYSQQI